MAKTILDVIHKTAKGLHKAGTMDAQTMREFDALCLPPEQPGLTEAKIQEQSSLIIKRAIQD